MMLRAFRRASVLALAILAACESGTDPEPQVPVDLVLDFCSNELPVWIAYRNQGADWVRLTPNGDGTVSFTATNDVALAIVRQNASDYDTEIIFAGNTELAAISGLTCREESGAKTVNGSVSGVVGSQVSQVGMSYASVYLNSNQTTFSLIGVPDRPVDLVASRFNVTSTNQSADRIVLRRTQNPVNNATLPVIDFTGTSAIIPTAFGATASGIGSGENAFAQAYFVSQLGTEHLLVNLEPVGNGSLTFVGVPAASLAADDYHDVFLIAVDASGAARGVERYLRIPATQALALGPAMGTPTVSEAGTTPYLRLRTQLVRSSTYARGIRAEFLQQQAFSSTRVTMTMTNGYDASGSWDMTIPDLKDVNGWQNAWGLVDGASSVEWTITAYGARPELLFGAPPTDGETVRFATRTNSINVAIAAAARGAASARLPRRAVLSR